MELMTSFVSPVCISRTIFCIKHSRTQEHFKNTTSYVNNFGTELMYVYKNKSTIYKVYLTFVSVS